MSFPPRNSNPNNEPHSELELLEGLLNNMFSGATNMIFQTLQEPFITEVDQQQQHSYSPMMEDLDGSDFRRIAEKKRQQRQQSQGTSDTNDNNNRTIDSQHDNSTSLTPINNRSPEYYRSISTPDNIIGNGLGGIVAALLGDFDPSTHPAGQDNDNNNEGWAFTSSSTSQRRTVRPDGTEETVITTTRNGKTETMTRIKLPDGTIQETRNIGERPSIMSLLSSSPDTPLALRDHDDHSSSPSPSFTNNPLSRLFRSIWG